MRRIEYRPLETAPGDIVAAIAARRGGDLINLDRMLLHSPVFAQGWNEFFAAVRKDLDLPAKLRELVMCCVAVLNGAKYEFFHHAPEFIKAGGTEAQLVALRETKAAVGNCELFDATEQAAIQLAVEMTSYVHVSDATFAEVKKRLINDQQLVELVGVIAAYNMVSRILIALEITPEENHEAETVYRRTMRESFSAP